MALFKPKQGYMSKPMQEQPMAAPKPTMGMMQAQPQQPRRSLMSVSEPQQQPAADTAPAVSYASQPTMAAPPQGGRRYGLVSNQLDTPEMASAKAAAVPYDVRTAAAQQGPAMAPYAPPLTSRFEGIVNPFGRGYLARAESQATAAAEEQATRARERVRQELSRAGIMRGGGLEGALMAQVARDAERERTRALREAQAASEEKFADFEMRLAAAIDPYGIQRAQLQRDLVLLQPELRTRQAAAEVAERTIEPTVQSKFSEAEQQNLQAESMQLANALKRYTPEQQAQIRESALKKAVSEGLIDERGAQELLRETDPNAWWNHPGWRIARGVMDFQKHIASIFGSVISATGGGR